jgi:hypothetical protein
MATSLRVRIVLVANTFMHEEGGFLGDMELSLILLELSLAQPYLRHRRCDLK